MKWQNHDPVAYQQWQNFNFGKQTAPHYSVVEHVSFTIGGVMDPILGFAAWNLHGVVSSGKRTMHRNLTTTTRHTIRAKTQTLVQLFPQMWRRHECLAIFLTNLLSPQWIQVECDVPLISNILCTKEHFSFPDLANEIFVSLGCYAFHVINNESCYYFSHFEDNPTNPSTKGQKAKAKKLKSKIVQGAWNVSMVDLKALPAQDHLQYLFEAIHPILHLPLEQKLGTSPTFDQQEYTIFHTSFSEHPIGNNVFSCEDGTYISSKNRCDDEDDCPNAIDEKHCVCQNITEKIQCKYLITEKSNRTCSSLFQKLPSNCCNAFTQTTFEKEIPVSRSFVCVQSKHEIDD